MDEETSRKVDGDVCDRNDEEDFKSNVKFVSGNLIQFIIWNHIFKCVEKV